MEAKIITCMFANWTNHLDEANCLNMTSLVEFVATELGDNRAGENIPEHYFELAFEVHEKLRKRGLINA